VRLLVCVCPYMLECERVCVRIHAIVHVCECARARANILSRVHTPTNTHRNIPTQKFSLSLSPSLTLSVVFSLSLSRSRHACASLRPSHFLISSLSPTHTHTHSCTRSLITTNLHKHTHKHTHEHEHTHTRTHTHTHTHAHAYLLSPSLAFSLSRIFSLILLPSLFPALSPFSSFIVCPPFSFFRIRSHAHTILSSGSGSWRCCIQIRIATYSRCSGLSIIALCFLAPYLTLHPPAYTIDVGLQNAL